MNTNQDGLDKIIGQAEIAERLGIHPRTVLTLVRRNGLPAFKVGGLWKIERSDLERWINEQKAKSKLEAQS